MFFKEQCKRIVIINSGILLFYSTVNITGSTSKKFKEKFNQYLELQSQNGSKYRGQ